MKIAEINTRRDWFELVKNADKSRTNDFIAVSELGWEECKRRWFSSTQEHGMQFGPLPEVVMGYSVVKVEDIADDEIELRTEPRRAGTGCSNCGKPVYIHRASQTWACSDPGCRTEGSVEHLGRWWTTQ